MEKKDDRIEEEQAFDEMETTPLTEEEEKLRNARALNMLGIPPHRIERGIGIRNDDQTILYNLYPNWVSITN